MSGKTIFEKSTLHPRANLSMTGVSPAQNPIMQEFQVLTTLHPRALASMTEAVKEPAPVQDLEAERVKPEEKPEVKSQKPIPNSNFQLPASQKGLSVLRLSSENSVKNKPKEKLVAEKPFLHSIETLETRK